MLRVLHVLDAQADFQTQRCVDQLVRGLGEGFAAESHTIGPRGSSRNLLAAVRRLRSSRSHDVIHAWGTTALLAAALSGVPRLLYTPPPAPSRHSLRWLRAVMNYRPVEVLCPSAAVRRLLVEHGTAAEHCHLIRPGVDFGRIQRRRNSAWRAALGLRDDDYVLLIGGESTRAAHHELAIWAGSILHVLNPQYKMLLWGRGDQAPAAIRFADRLYQSGGLRIAESLAKRPVDFEELLPAADMILFTPDAPVATLPISICMAAGLPLVGTASYALSELLEDHHTALLAPPDAPRLLARRVLELRDDAGLQWSLADMARTEAYEYFSLTRFLNQHRSVYRQFAGGERVEITEPAPGAGLRFHAVRT